MKFSRSFAMPSHKTFSIKPIKELLSRYVGDGKGWDDPYAGWLSPAEITNDMNPDRNAKYCLDAVDFAKELIKISNELNGVLFDPPYSYRQVSEHYKQAGRKATALDTSSNFYNRVIDPMAKLIRPGGLAISFGWNTTGFRKKNGFEPIEILIVCHGGHHNDTLVTVDRKIS
jgi:hypothetical protein